MPRSFLVLLALAVAAIIALTSCDSGSSSTTTGSTPPPAAVTAPFVRVTPAPAAVAATAATRAPAVAPTAAPTAAPVAVPVAGPTFLVNELPVDCHSQPSSSSAVVGKLEVGTVQAVDQRSTQNADTWHRENTKYCWIRSQPGLVRSFDSLSAAETFARSVRPAPSPPPPAPVAVQPPPPAQPPAPQGCPQGCASPPQGCAIKGNVSYDTGERIYHVPGGQFYNATVIDPRYGERWFCTEAEARANGWRRSAR